MPETSGRREQVLGRVAALVRQFVEKVSLQRGYSASAAKLAGGKIFTFGSYRLGVHGPGSDIDTLCVVPKHVSRDDFFDTFEPMLRDFEGCTEVAVCQPLDRMKRFTPTQAFQGVPEAYVPIIKVKVSGIPLDLLMARLLLPQISEDMTLKDDNLLKNLDERCIRSLNGEVRT